MNKKVLLIGGGGTLGTYTAEELLRQGAYVDVVCPEEKESCSDFLRYYRGLGTEEILGGMFAENHYDGIVNFIHYTNPDEYKKIHNLLISNTDHLIFLSSYRVYADKQHPITEEAPRLYDTVGDREFLEKEDYAVRKSICEDFLKNECVGQNWTIVRPVISFSSRRLDLLLYGRRDVLDYAESGEEMVMPELVRNYSAGFDWAGNSGKLIANLLFKTDAVGECFTVYSGHGLKWGEVADIYSELTGVKIRWCDEDEFVEKYSAKVGRDIRRYFGWIYDRRFNRDVDCSKILRVTGFTQKDFKPIREAIKLELENLSSHKQ